MLEKIKKLLTRDGHISNIDDELPDDIHGIYFHHIGIDGTDTNRLAIREYRNETTGNILLLVEFKPIDNEWKIQNSEHDTLATVTGENSYKELARAISNELRSLDNY